jgi:PleD family two-component response regulator
MPAEETRVDSALPESAERPESQSRILVVDDHEDNIEVLKVRLEMGPRRCDTSKRIPPT